jgi:acetoin:2,6-dichlorophenolindophenol oxidoreductase subunit alpha
MVMNADGCGDSTGIRGAESGMAQVESEQLLGFLEQMTFIRRFEEEVQNRFLRGEVPGTTHLCNGHEAIPVGLAAALRPDDLLATTYRGHGHVLARGADPVAVAAELAGRVTGLNGGRGGSMNLTDFSHGILGSFGIIGGSIGAATGAALSLRKTGRIAVATFGDGCDNHGYFFECLNFAAVFQLPILFVCEHNLYGEYTPWEQVTAGTDIAARARVFGITAERIDGMDVRTVYDHALRAVERIRTDGGPQFLECRTYRFVGHSRSDPASYRPAGELERWLERDPLKLAREALAAASVPEGVIGEAESAARLQVTEAFAEAMAAPFPEPAVVA